MLQPPCPQDRRDLRLAGVDQPGAQVVRPLLEHPRRQRPAVPLPAHPVQRVDAVAQQRHVAEHHVVEDRLRQPEPIGRLLGGRVHRQLPDHVRERSFQRLRDRALVAREQPLEVLELRPRVGVADRRRPEVHALDHLAQVRADVLPIRVLHKLLEHVMRTLGRVVVAHVRLPDELQRLQIALVAGLVVAGPGDQREAVAEQPLVVLLVGRKVHDGSAAPAVLGIHDVLHPRVNPLGHVAPRVRVAVVPAEQRPSLHVERVAGLVPTVAAFGDDLPRPVAVGAVVPMPGGVGAGEALVVLPDLHHPLDPARIAVVHHREHVVHVRAPLVGMQRVGDLPVDAILHRARPGHQPDLARRLEQHLIRPVHQVQPGEVLHEHRVIVRAIVGAKLPVRHLPVLDPPPRHALAQLKQPHLVPRPLRHTLRRRRESRARLPLLRARPVVVGGHSLVIRPQCAKLVQARVELPQQLDVRRVPAPRPRLTQPHEVHLEHPHLVGEVLLLAIIAWQEGRRRAQPNRLGELQRDPQALSRLEQQRPRRKLHRALIRHKVEHHLPARVVERMEQLEVGHGVRRRFEEEPQPDQAYHGSLGCRIGHDMHRAHRRQINRLPALRGREDGLIAGWILALDDPPLIAQRLRIRHWRYPAQFPVVAERAVVHVQKLQVPHRSVVAAVLLVDRTRYVGTLGHDQLVEQRARHERVVGGALHDRVRLAPGGNLHRAGMAGDHRDVVHGEVFASHLHIIAEALLRVAPARRPLGRELPIHAGHLRAENIPRGHDLRLRHMRCPPPLRPPDAGIVEVQARDAMRGDRRPIERRPLAHVLTRRQRRDLLVIEPAVIHARLIEAQSSRGGRARVTRDG